MSTRFLVTTFAVMTIGILATFGIVASLQALPPGGIAFDDNYFTDSAFTNWVGETLPDHYVLRETYYCDSSSGDTCDYYHCSGYPWDRDECDYMGSCY